MPAPTLDALGPRVCILGPSNSGKSTLALAIAAARDLPVVHLDRLHHEPGSDWRPRPPDVFARLHDEAVHADRWVMDGNYSRLLPTRLARATGVILLEATTATSLLRYLRRSWFQRERAGGLEGGRDSVKWAMVRHIVVTTPPNRRRYAALFDEVRLPKARLAAGRELEAFSRSQGLRARLAPSASAGRTGRG